MHSDARTVDEYLASLPEERREAVAEIRGSILANLPAGYEDGMQYGMIGYYVPLERYPTTYNGQALSYAAIASQKNYISVYLSGIYSDPEAAEWFREEYAKTGRKPNMGKSCVRFKKLADLPLDLIGQTIARVSVDAFIERYEQSRA
jgi:uncharacterized protein YdhG (YjbR/CyaY superfamily)